MVYREIIAAIGAVFIHNARIKIQDMKNISSAIFPRDYLKLNIIQ